MGYETTLDCGDSSCMFAKELTGQRTNGGCRCLKELPSDKRLAVKRYIKFLEKENKEISKKFVDMKSYADYLEIRSLKTIQSEHKEWQEKNFGDVPAYQSLLGVVEEVGELAHSHLKQEQGIRNGEQHDELIKDAIGDIVVFLMSYCSARDYDLSDIIKNVWDEVKKRDWKANPDSAHKEENGNE